MEECAQCASSAHDVHHASVCLNVVIGVLVVLCELHVIVRVHVIPLCVDAVVGLTLGLIAHVVIVVFVVAIIHRIFLYGRYTLHISRSHFSRMFCCIGGIVFTSTSSSHRKTGATRCVLTCRSGCKNFGKIWFFS